jgi:hypothetical protein
MALKHVKHIDPYSPQSETVIPDTMVKFLRTCVVWQIIRFIIINIRMTKLILKSHH